MTMLTLFVFVLGLTIGSFLNVCICRIPRGESVVFPSSHCPHCGSPIRVYDNIPLLSYLLLRGKCRNCGGRISWQYPVVELLTATVFSLTFARLGLEPRTGVLWVFFAAIIVLSIIDLQERVLPNIITLPGIAVGLVSSVISPLRDGTARWVMDYFEVAFSQPRLYSLFDSLIGALLCGAFLWLVAEVYFRVRKIEGLGFGDIKLMGMVGAFLGIKLALFTIMLGSFLGAVIGIVYIKASGKGSRYELPFGTFLGAASIIAALWGNQILQWYFTFPRH